MTRCFILLCCFLLAACSPQYDYFYYMTHPDALREAVIHCLEDNHASTESECQMVNKAQKDFEEYVNEEHTDPQAFGKKIMVEENQMMSLQEDLLRLKAAQPVDRVKFHLTKQADHEQQQKVAILLSIVAVTSWSGL